jgi:hypothetical protein
LGQRECKSPAFPAGLRVSTTLRSAFLLLPALLLIALLAFLPGLLLLLLLATLLLPALLLATLLLATLLLLFLILILILILAHGVLFTSARPGWTPIGKTPRRDSSFLHPGKLELPPIRKSWCGKSSNGCMSNGTLSSALADRCTAADPVFDLAPGRPALIAGERREIPDRRSITCDTLT